MIRRLFGLSAAILLSSALAGCNREKVETRYTTFTQDPTPMVVKKEGVDTVIFPTSLVSAIGWTETYGDSKYPQYVTVGGDVPIRGSGYDFNGDGKLDRLEKENPEDTFTFNELEKTLIEVRERATNNPSNIVHSTRAK